MDSKYGNIKHGLCPNCLREITDCIELNDGPNKCEINTPQSFCTNCFEFINKCKCKKITDG